MTGIFHFIFQINSLKFKMELTFRAPFSVDRPEEKWLKATCATAGNCTVLGRWVRSKLRDLGQVA